MHPAACRGNPANNTMYLVSNQSLGPDAQLYTVDLATGALTPIAAVAVQDLMFLAIDNNGMAYTARELASYGVLFSLDLTTGATTLVDTMFNAPIFSFLFPHAASFDPATNELYMTVKDVSGATPFYIVDVATAEATLVGSDDSNHNYSVLAISGDPVSGVAEPEYVLKEVYPNPTSGPITINLEPGLGNVKVEVLDAKGSLEQVISYNAGSQIQLDIEGESGLYFVVVKTDNRNFAPLRITKL